MSYGKEIQALKLFNEKAEKLKRFSFTDKILNDPSGFKMKFRSGEGLQVKRQGPDEESINAFVLTLRFFLQDNESCSFRNMAEHYQNLPISEEKRESFKKERKFINELLDKESYIRINEEKLQNKKILETFLYGELAHANKEKKKDYDEWIKSPMKIPLVNEFVRIIAKFLMAIFHVADLNREVIQELKN